MCDAHGLGDLYQSTIVQVQFVSLVQLIAVFVIGISEEVARLVVYHNPAIEGMEFQVAILPSFLFPSNILSI
jgi:hypothetical protein